MQALKTVFLRDTDSDGVAAPRLVLRCGEDAAHLLAFTLQLALMPDEKDDAQDESSNQSIPAGAQVSEVEADDVIEPDLSPAALASMARSKTLLAALCRNPSACIALARCVDIAVLVSSKGFLEAQNNHASHPTRLSAGAGRGGFIKSTHQAMPADFASVTESDFTTCQDRTLTCSAGYQKNWFLLLPLVEFEGTLYRLSSLLAERRDLAEATSAVFLAHDVEQGPALVEAVSQAGPARFFGEPQVFAGDLPQVQRLSVFTPFSLFKESARAKAAIIRAYRDEQITAADAIEDDITATEDKISRLTEIADGVPGLDKAARKEATEAKKVLKETLRTLKADKKAATAYRLYINSQALLFGGSTPRNTALDLDKSLHSANVRVFIPTRVDTVDTIGRRVLVTGQSARSLLLDVPTLPVFEKLPRCLAPKAARFEDVKHRRSLFSGVIADVLVPLLALQDAWRARAIQATGAGLLEQAAVEAIESADTDWSLFVKGDTTLTTQEATERLEPLAVAVVKNVKATLMAACHNKLSAAFDAELLKLVRQRLTEQKA